MMKLLDPDDIIGMHDVVVACVIDRAGRILHIKCGEDGHFPRRWALPGGKPFPGESVDRTAQRELFEETGFWSHEPLKDKIVYTGLLYHPCGKQLSVCCIVMLMPDHVADVATERTALGVAWLSREESFRLEAIPPAFDVIIDLAQRGIIA